MDNSLYSNTNGKNTLDSEGGYWNNLGFVFIGQDFRGKHGSNGSYSFFRTAGNDSLDTIVWMMNQTWSNQYATIVGVSADALNQYADIIGATQSGGTEEDFIYWNGILNHIRSGYLELGDGLGKNTVYQNGALRTCLIEGWLTTIFEPEYIPTIWENEAFSSYWYPLAGNWTEWDEYHPNEAQWSVANLSLINLAGWYDIFGNNQIATVIAVNNTADIEAKGNQILVVDPGGHCEEGGEIFWGNRSFGVKEMDKYAPIVFNASVEAAIKGEFFNVHDYVPFNVLFYMLGSGKGIGNYWVAAESFPPSTSLHYYLSDGFTLTTDTPNFDKHSASYLYDPTHPVITRGGNNLLCQPCGPWDQTNIEKNRTDILTWKSPPLSNQISLVGKIIVNLFVSSDRIDTDFTAKILDIYDGKMMLVQDGILRMRWRNGDYATKKAPDMIKDNIYMIAIDVGYMSYIFAKGHEIGISISSSNYPRFSVNYNNGELIIDDPSRNPKIANNTIHFGEQYPSMIIFPIIDMDW
eukprot:CAMPEP_0114656994 /NCGR_PEP_ID=MMETSP0191-20121206/13202_1 /TAXON_ID=126664 /ORGANISM="Sorites sp." /LENGTH=520 /DNA_ID=CAMNT_0001875369 /DNA_START=227 /DNA_END=1787 /DNA_ORIENTATION=+